jgi:hypothetical protein
MNSKNIIFGTLALAIVGGGAYFYFKNKKKGSLADTLASSLTNTGGGTGSDSGTGTGGGTGSSNSSLTKEQLEAKEKKEKEELEAKVKLIAKAKDFASKICDAKTQKNLFKNMSNYDFCNKYAISGTSCSNTTEVEQQKNSRIRSIEKSITSLNTELGLLGYMESNCEISKIIK